MGEPLYSVHTDPFWPKSPGGVPAGRWKTADPTRLPAAAGLLVIDVRRMRALGVDDPAHRARLLTEWTHPRAAVVLDDMHTPAMDAVGELLPGLPSHELTWITEVKEGDDWEDRGCRIRIWAARPPRADTWTADNPRENMPGETPVRRPETVAGRRMPPLLPVHLWRRLMWAYASLMPDRPTVIAYSGGGEAGYAAMLEGGYMVEFKPEAAETPIPGWTAVSDPGADAIAGQLAMGAFADWLDGRPMACDIPPLVD